LGLHHLAELPDLLDHADRLAADGIMTITPPNAATFQIAPSLRLLANFSQLEPLLGDRPAVRLARQLLPEYPGRVPAVLPAAWLARAARR
jgi:hypothetical protein